MTEIRAGVPVAWRERPFASEVHRDVLPEGLSCAEIVARVPNLPAAFWDEGVVCINGEVVPRERWHMVRPKARPNVAVTLHLPVQGGIGKFFKTIAAIAIVAVAAVISAGALAPVLGAAFAAGSIGATLTAGAVTVLGTLALGALSAPPSVGPQASGRTGDESFIQASLSGNVLRRGAPVPRVLGTLRVFPPQLCEPLIDLDPQTGKEIAEGVYGLAGPHKLEGVQIDDTDVDDVDEVEYETREGFPDDDPLEVVTRYGKLLTQGIDLSQHEMRELDDGFSGRTLRNQSQPLESCPQWHFINVRGTHDEVWLNLNFNEGLYWRDRDDDVLVHFRIEVRAAGTSTWVQLPELGYEHKAQRPLSFMVKLVWGSIAGGHPSGDPRGWRRVFYRITNPINDSTFQAHSHFYAGSGDVWLTLDSNEGSSGIRNVRLSQYVATVYLPESAVPKGPIEVRIKRGQAIEDGHFQSSSYNTVDEPGQFSGRYSHFTYQSISGTARTLFDQNEVSDRCQVQRVFGVTNSPPVAVQGEFAVVAMKVRERQVRAVSVLASGYVPDWDEEEEDWVGWHVTSNPAPHFRDVLAGPLGGDPVPEDLVEDDELVAWRQHCEDMGYEVNAVVEGLSAADVLTLVASCGYARPRQSERWGVMVDKDRTEEAPVQVFSPRNLRDFRWERALTRRPDGLRVRFTDKNDAYRERQIIVSRIAFAGMVQFTGSTSLAEGAGLEGAGDSKQLSLSVWLQPEVGAELPIFGLQSPAASADGTRVYVQADGTLRLVALDSDGDTILDAETTEALADGEWQHVAVSVDLGLGVAKVWIDGVPATMTVGTIEDEEIAWELLVSYVGRNHANSVRYEGGMADLWIAQGAALDFDEPSVLQKFRSGDGLPVYLGAQGQLPTGEAPLIFLSGPPSTWHENRGTGGGFSITGSLSEPELSILEPNLLEDIRYDGLVTEAEARARAIYDLRQADSRFTFYYGTADLEALVCQRGDIVAVQHDTLDQVAGFSRVRAITLDGGTGDVLAVTLDGTVVDPGGSFGAAIRLKDGTVLVKEVTVDGTGLVLTFATPFEAPAGLAPGCLVVTGALGREYRRLLVLEMQMRNDETVQLTMVDEAPELWT